MKFQVIQNIHAILLVKLYFSSILLKLIIYYTKCFGHPLIFSNRSFRPSIRAFGMSPRQTTLTSPFIISVILSAFFSIFHFHSHLFYGHTLWALLKLQVPLATPCGHSSRQRTQSTKVCETVFTTYLLH